MTTWLPRGFACLVLLLPFVPVIAAPPGSQSPIADALRLRDQVPEDIPPVSAQMKDGVLTTFQHLFITETQKMQETIERDGKSVRVLRDINVVFSQAYTQRTKAKYCTFFILGKEGQLETIDADKAAALLKKSTPVLLGGRNVAEVAPRNLELVKPGTLYIALAADRDPNEIPGTPEAKAPVGLAPLQSLASIDAQGKLIITRVTNNCYCQASNREMILKAFEKKGDEKVAVDVKITITTRMVTRVEMPVHSVEAYTADGKPLSAEKLATLLAKEQTVLVTMDGKKLDPFLLPLYKGSTIILVPPANTINMGYGSYRGAYKERPREEQPKDPPVKDGMSRREG